MSSPFPWATALMFMGALQGLLLFAALGFSKKRRSAANRLLAILMILTAVRLVHVAITRLGIWPGRMDWSLPLILTFSPLLYLYCRALLEPRSAWRLVHLVHFAPAVVWAAWRGVRSLVSSSTPEAPNVTAAWLASYWPDIFWLVQTIVYLILIRRLLRRHAGRSAGELSDVGSVRLIWIRALSAAFGFLCALIAFFLAGTALGLEFIRPSNTVLYVSVALIVYLWGWFGLRQPEIFLVPALAGEERPAEPPSPNTAENLKRLQKVMDERSPHLAPRLTLHDLALASGLPAYQLTDLLNRELGQSFYEFVNRRRVDEAKRMLADPAYDKIKILAIALDCGFASKSAFNRVFREMTGLTPSAFRQSLRSGAKNG